MVEIAGFFDSDSPYAKAVDNDDFSEVTEIVAAGADEYNGDSFIWVKVDGVDKPIRLNKTNGRTLAAFGPDTDKWIGKAVFLTTREVTLGDGRNTRGWVFSPMKPKKKMPDDDIPF